MKIVLHKSRKSNNTIIVGDFSIFILSILIFISEIPIFARNVSNVLYYGLVIVFLLSTSRLLVKMETAKNVTLLWLALYLFLISVYKVFSISTTDISYYSTTVKYLFFLVAMLALSGHMLKAQKIYLIVVTLGSMLYTIIDNIRLFNIYGPTVFVHLFQWERFSTNSVNTTYVSSLLLLSGIMFVFFFHTKRIPLKIVSIALVALCLLFITVIAQRMIIFGLSVVMFPLLALYNQKYSYKRLVIVLIISTALIIVYANLTAILDAVDTFIGSGRLHLRFEQMKLFLTTGQMDSTDSTLSARVKLYLQSIHTWFSSVGRFIFGAGDHRITDEIIGNHSDYIDECARYGIVGLLVWVPMTISFMKNIIQFSDVKKHSPLSRQLNVILLIFIANAILSSVYEATVGIQLFIILPILFSLMQDGQGNADVQGTIKGAE